MSLIDHVSLPRSFSCIYGMFVIRNHIELHSMYHWEIIVDIMVIPVIMYSPRKEKKTFLFFPAIIWCFISAK